MRAILTYHSVDDSGSPISVSLASFAEDVRWLSSGGVPVVSVEELLSRPADEPAIAITFDDGLANFATDAWPLLRDHGLPVTLFVVTQRVGSRNDWNLPGAPSIPSLPLLTWDALGEIAAQGVLLGAHTRTHRDLRMLDDVAIGEEIVGSCDEIEHHTGAPPSGFAYPYGFYDERAILAARAACGWACTTKLRSLSARDDRHLLPRLDAYFLRGPGSLRKYGKPAFRAYLDLRHLIRQVQGR